MAKAPEDNKPSGPNDKPPEQPSTAGQIHVVKEGEIRMYAESGMSINKNRPGATITLGDEHQSRWQGDPVEKLLSELFPQGVPDQLSNVDLIDMVRNRMRGDNVKHIPHPDTILRAAGRKRRLKPRRKASR
jgi:hypothetical protein